MKTNGRKPRKKKQLSESQIEWEYIIRKFVKSDKIIWARDLSILHGILKDFPDFRFWHVIPAYFQVASLTALLSKGSQDFLKIEWAKFNLQPIEREAIILEPVSVCEAIIYPSRRPRSILAFCKK